MPSGGAREFQGTRLAQTICANEVPRSFRAQFDWAFWSKSVSESCPVKFISKGPLLNTNHTKIESGMKIKPIDNYEIRTFENMKLETFEKV